MRCPDRGCQERGPATTASPARGWYDDFRGQSRGSEVAMKPITIVGILLIILGVVALAYQGITYTSNEKVVDLGPLKVEAKRRSEERRVGQGGSAAAGRRE